MYRLLLLLHVGGVVIFMGTIVSALVWQHAAQRAQQRQIIAHTYHMLNRFDAVMTPIAVITIAVTGVLLADLGNMSIFGTGWILWSLVAWAISGLLFVTTLLPLQKRLERDADNDALWDKARESYMQLSSRWSRWAHLTVTGILVAFALMILKPALPMP